MDGVSLTHGNPREHIWTFAASLDRNDNLTDGWSSHCPWQLNFDINPFDPPPFVGEDCFCDSGIEDYVDLYYRGLQVASQVAKCKFKVMIAK